MTVDVDESGDDEQSARAEIDLCTSRGQVAYRGNEAARDADVPRVRWTTGAVENRSVAQNNVEDGIVRLSLTQETAHEERQDGAGDDWGDARCLHGRGATGAAHASSTSSAVNAGRLVTRTVSARQ